MTIDMTFISDTHGLHRSMSRTDIGVGDILFHTGDFSNYGWSKQEAIDFLSWFNSIDSYPYKVFIAGNHDNLAFHNEEWFRDILTRFSNIVYLQDNDVELYGLKIYGYPWTKHVSDDWSFGIELNSIEESMCIAKIPYDVDILLSHGPVHGILDLSTFGNEHIGSHLLKQFVLEHKPRIFAHGHVHADYGRTRNRDTDFINSALLSRNGITRKALTFEQFEI